MAMAAVTPISLFILSPNFNPSHEAGSFRSKAFLQRSVLLASSHSFFCIHPSLVFRSRLLFRIARRRQFSCVNCSAENKPSPSSDISSTAKIRSEVLSPFRSVRMFFYLAFIASGALGGLITITRLISSLANPSKTLLLPEILKDLSIDLGAVFLFYFLYSRENEAKNVQLAKLFREESLSQLKLRIDQKKIVPINDLRGIARLVILAGPATYINESFKLSEPFTEGLLERGVLVVPFATDMSKLEFESVDCKEQLPIDEKRKKLWQLRPFNVAEWSNWIGEQKKLATVSLDSPVYLSLRMDGRVRGSGVGYPPWNAFVAQLPPVKGLWSGILDGMDGRVLPHHYFVAAFLSFLTQNYTFLNTRASAEKTTTFTIINNCRQTIWPGILSGAGIPLLSTTGFELQSGQWHSIEAPSSWSGRLWARTSCVFDDSKPGFCLTGDCGTGEVECNGKGAAPPVTLAEFTLGDEKDFYDVSLVDGYNLPMVIEGEKGNCAVAGCAVDVNEKCPPELRVGEAAVACRSACAAFGGDEYCCSGEFASPAKCKPTAYSEVFKTACPDSYSYAFDDASSIFTCAGAGQYTVTFCPLANPSEKSSTEAWLANLTSNSPPEPSCRLLDALIVVFFSLLSFCLS
ncbi:hypothetical protein M5K25_016181 [Dendrobium thyrsiflorum]|uniref:Uncharacterized protein n=1 Tax=Dendrobium thyrsiflorum TaxID=117978 RepID=A0ABD0URF0_DENTH